MSTVLGKEQLELFCVLSWRLWCCRNNVLWNSKNVEPKQIIDSAIFYLQDYRRALLSRGRGATSVQKLSETKWKPPDEGMIKINVDGAVFEQQRMFGSGAVARNSVGEVLAAITSKGNGFLSAEESEACSLRKALQWAKDFMFDNIVVEVDCASIVTAIHSGTHSLNSSLGAILSDCHHLMASFTSCQLQHVRRSGNSVAHELARRALQAEDDRIWVGVTPDFIAHHVTGDKRNCHACNTPVFCYE
ncbi:hypothetical protein SLA2020_023680 [Shorea laevis]